jgi:hypothetical protein
MDILVRITELCTNNTENKKLLKQFIELANLVFYNYKHIQQFETLIKLFAGGLSDYTKEYYPEESELAALMVQVCENTRANVYKAKGEELQTPTLTDVMEIFQQNSQTS